MLLKILATLLTCLPKITSKTLYFKPFTLAWGLKQNAYSETYLGYSSYHLYECAAYGHKKFYENCINWECNRQLDTVNSIFKYQFPNKQDLHHLPEDYEKDFLNIMLIEANPPLKVIKIAYYKKFKRKCVTLEDECTGFYSVLRSDMKTECPRKYIKLMVKVG